MPFLSYGGILTQSYVRTKSAELLEHTFNVRLAPAAFHAGRQFRRPASNATSPPNALGPGSHEFQLTREADGWPYFPSVVPPPEPLPLPDPLPPFIPFVPVSIFASSTLISPPWSLPPPPAMMSGTNLM
jgi:hypothetical protein